MCIRDSILQRDFFGREDIQFTLNIVKLDVYKRQVVTDSTKKNLELRVEAEYGATAGKTDLAVRAKKANLDAIHDTVHEMARDEARHGKALKGLLERYFG